jgi:hypothetical protein
MGEKVLQINHTELRPKTGLDQSERFDVKTRDVLDQFLKNLSAIEAIFEDLLKANRKKIIITNIGHTHNDPGFSYALTLTRQQIDYHEKKAKTPLHITFNLENFALTINGKEALAHSLDILVSKFQSVLEDLSHKKASVYEQSSKS